MGAENSFGLLSAVGGAMWLGVVLAAGAPGAGVAVVGDRMGAGNSSPTTAPRSRGVAAVLAPTGITIVAVWVLISETTEHCATTVTSTGSSIACSSVTTPTHASVALALTCVAAVVGWLVAQPKRDSVRTRGRL